MAQCVDGVGDFVPEPASKHRWGLIDPVVIDPRVFDPNPDSRGLNYPNIKNMSSWAIGVIDTSSWAIGSLL